MNRRSVVGFVTSVLIVFAADAVTTQSAPALLLFGGRNHEVFLGCLNCGRFDGGSVCNPYGQQGNRFSGDSIWNRFSEYGSKFSSYSPWNKFAIEPPIIVDRDGNSYGYFTSNKFHRSRTTIRALLGLLNYPDEVNEDLQRARDLFCE